MLKKVWNIITTLVVIVVVILACIMFLPKLFGITPMAVLSGSMEPTYHVGSLVFIKDTDPETIKVGDPITFEIGSGSTVVTHRVIKVNTEEKTFETKGDNNDNTDGAGVAFSKVRGKAYDFSIPLLGYLAVYLGTTQGMIIMVTTILVIIILSFLIDSLTKDRDKERGVAK